MAANALAVTFLIIETEMLARGGIVTICIYRSTPDSIAMYAKKHLGDAPIALSDRRGSVYSSFQVKKSTAAVLIHGQMEAYKKSYRQYWSMSDIMKDTKKPGNGSHNQLPADFIIDEEGVIVDLFRASSIKDHMPFERIEAFIPENKRCKCYKKDCISRRCREEYEEIKRQSASMLFMGAADDEEE